MFPILDLKGRVVAFGGRVMDDSKPKYLNSPESPIFNKRRLLFAIYQALPEIRKSGRRSWSRATWMRFPCMPMVSRM